MCGERPDRPADRPDDRGRDTRHLPLGVLSPLRPHWLLFCNNLPPPRGRPGRLPASSHRTAGVTRLDGVCGRGSPHHPMDGESPVSARPSRGRRSGRLRDGSRPLRMNGGLGGGEPRAHTPARQGERGPRPRGSARGAGESVQSRFDERPPPPAHGVASKAVRRRRAVATPAGKDHDQLTPGQCVAQPTLPRIAPVGSAASPKSTERGTAPRDRLAPPGNSGGGPPAGHGSPARSRRCASTIRSSGAGSAHATPGPPVWHSRYEGCGPRIEWSRFPPALIDRMF